MKFTFFALLLLLSTDPREIARTNSLKKEAEKAFLAKDFEQAAEKYVLLDSLGYNDPSVKLNLGHAYYQLNDTSKALSAYQAASMSADKKIQSIAYQQLGAMSKQSKKLEQALNYFKSSLKANPTNQGARYDYELVKKLLEEQKKQEQQNQDKNQEDQKDDQQKQDQQNKDQNSDNQQKQDQSENKEENKEKQEQEADKDGEKKEGENKEGEEKESKEEPTPEEMMKEKLKEMNISEEKAKMILEAMKNNEIQYLQQQRRKPTKRPSTGKPDW